MPENAATATPPAIAAMSRLAPNAAAMSPPTTVSSASRNVSEHAARLRRSERLAARGSGTEASGRDCRPGIGHRCDGLGDRSMGGEGRSGARARRLGRVFGFAPLGDRELLGRLGCEPRGLLVLVQDALLRHDLARRRLDANGLGGLGGLGEDAQGLLQTHRIALGREVLPPTEPARQEVRDPQRSGHRDQDPPADHIHVPTVGHRSPHGLAGAGVFSDRRAAEGTPRRRDPRRGRARHRRARVRRAIGEAPRAAPLRRRARTRSGRASRR